MNCNHCGSPNQDGARFCNNCAAALNTPLNQQQNKKNDRWKWFLGIVIGFCVLSGIIRNLSSKTNQTPSPTSSNSQSAPTNKWNSTDGKIEAFVMSQTFMTKQLKAPASAEFPYYSDSEVSVIHRGGGTFMVKSYVDAQNSFGAKLRTHYICELKDNGNDNWSLVSLVTPK